ncbi:DUF3422 family protein [Elioraea sp.]|uniref:DUF3422 family protein n=1 Tax=Elioraea sp. TaxID=2185103 RepID=UPI0021DD9D16|nr:DUF3422 domain-containing protein [Elioraea sp.]GIX10176.1 MAG: hypothetical protein KatS3mg116_1886 [Elioraea sp.]
MADHPLRATINDELHARPHPRLTAPAALSHVVLMASEAEAEADHARFAAFCGAHGVAPPPAGARHHAVALAGRTLRWERHGEFIAVTAIADAASELGTDGWSAFAPPIAAWLATEPGARLAAVHLRVLPGIAAAPPADTFAGEVVGSTVAEGEGAAFADFRIGPDGFTRMLLYAHRLTPGRLGRMAQRLLELETYRMAALLGLPPARAATPLLAAFERRLDAIVAATSASAEDDHLLLDRLTRLAAEAEAQSAANRFRFAATEAYGALVITRIAELQEGRIEGVQRLGVFLERRFVPGLRTCAAVARRERTLLDGIARAASMLRTRVEVRLAAQNRDLLEAMDRRARLQLRLSQAVEGLSVFAIAYYAVSLLKYLADGVPLLGLPEMGRAAGLLGPPLVLAAAWYGVRRIRKGLRREEP